MHTCDFLPSVFLSCVSIFALLSHSADITAVCGSVGQPMCAPNEDCKKCSLNQTECRRDASIAAFVIVEQQHSHDHSLACVEKERRAKLPNRQDEKQRHRRDHARAC